MDIIIPEGFRSAYVAVVLTITMVTNIYLVARILYLDYRDRLHRRKLLQKDHPPHGIN